MADSVKKEKIAAARKKLKQFKQKTGKNSPTPTNSKSGANNASSAKKQKIPSDSPQNDVSTNEIIIDNQLKEENKITNSNDIPNEVSKNTTSNSVNNNPETTSNSNTSNRNTDTASSPNNIHLDPKTASSPTDLRTTSSTESLQQLSRQLNGLLADSSAFAEDVESSDLAELERRNRELASLLEKQKQVNDQLNIQIQQIREHAKTLQDQIEKERDNFTEKQKQEIGPLKEQLQVHIQTIGILVAEKTELQSQLSQSQKISEQRFNEVEELSGRLKASRQRVADLERTVSTSNSSSQQFENSSKEFAKEVDRLKLDLFKSNKQQEELKQQSIEIGEKLQAKVSECVGLEQTAEDLRKRLEMAELYTQQLSSQSDSSTESLQLIDQLQREKEELNKKIHEVTDAFQRASQEKDQVTEQYQQYMDQLQQHSQQLTNQVTALTSERENLVTRQHELEGAVLELQRKLEDVDLLQQSSSNAANAEMQGALEKLRSEFEGLQERHETQVRDNAQLSRFLGEKEEVICELERTVTQLKDEAGDKAQLLDSVQSDKTALSRALTQNKDLKQQLAELQSGFVKLSNDNMELMTKVQGEQHSSAEMLCRLGQQDEEIKQLRETLSQRESQMSELEENSHLVKKEMFQQEQIHDRLRHYEAQAQLVESLRRELHNAQDMIDALTTQNSELRTMLIKASDRSTNGSLDPEDEQKRDDVIESLTGAVKQLETERNQLVQSLKEQRDLSDRLSVNVADLQEELVQKKSTAVSGNPENDKINSVEYEQMKRAMELIQEKYTTVMRDKAELSDKADQLEHIVLQLQGETDTIGEYISLYHHQRALLQQRESQKNDYISHLARDREEMQAKLGELQSLVMQLLGEKNMLHNYHEESFKRVDSPDVQPHLHNSVPNLVNGHPEADWPDYTSSESDTESEVEAIVGGKDNLSANAEQLSREHTPVQTETDHVTTSEIPHSQNNEVTASKILNLLSEIGHSNLVDRTTCIDHNFLPCKYCKGQVQIV